MRSFNYGKLKNGLCVGTLVGDEKAKDLLLGTRSVILFYLVPSRMQLIFNSFMNNAYFIFDIDKKSVGLAALAPIANAA